MDYNMLERKATQDNFATEQVDVVQNNLLGFYDDNGQYSIMPQILEELIALPKVKKHSFHNSMFCAGHLLGFGEITFVVDYDKKIDDKDFAKATLYVLEEVDKINGYLQNTLKTKVADFENTVDNFIEASYDYFHITIDTSTDASTDEGMERKILDDISNQDSFILAKKQFTLQLDKLSNEKCFDAYGKYFTFRYSALTKMNNAFSQAVIELFEEEYARIEKFFLKDKNYKMLNELLDKCIEEISGTSENYIAQEQEYNDLISSAMENFSDSIKELHEKLGNKALNMLTKEDRDKMQDIMKAEEYHNNHTNEPEIQQNIEPQPIEPEQVIEENVIEEEQPIVEEVAETQEAGLEDEVISQIFETRSKDSVVEEVKNANVNDKVEDQSQARPEEVQATTQSYIANKVLDTNRTNNIDESMNETPEVDAVSTLHASVGRLSALTSKTDNEKTSEKDSNDDFVHAEVASYLNDNIKEEIPQEVKEEIKSKPRSFEALFSYLNEQNKIKNDEIALRNQRNREIHEQTQETIQDINREL